MQRHHFNIRPTAMRAAKASPSRAPKMAFSNSRYWQFRREANPAVGSAGGARLGWLPPVAAAAFAEESIIPARLAGFAAGLLACLPNA